MPGGPGSWRRRPLPPDWETRIRPAVLERDGHACQWRMGAGLCMMPASEVDHIDNDGPDEMWNLRSLCSPHHRHKSSAEGGRGLGQIRKRMAAARHREPESHPGWI